MAFLSNLLKGLSGPSHNSQFAHLLLKLADVAVACAAHFRETAGQDLRGIIDFEHAGDAIVDEIQELLDNAFIFRFDVGDALRLTDDLDNVIDGIRKAAFHIDIYKPILNPLRPEALQLLAIEERMIGDVRRLVAMLSEKSLPLGIVRDLANVIDEGEAEADRIVADAERKLVAEYRPQGANRLEFIAWDKLYQLLEETTDEANHCGKAIASLARKEA